METLSWRKYLKLNDVEQDEDTLVEERPQIERGTMFHRDTRHRAIHQRNIRDKWFPREACFDLGDIKAENVIVAFREEEEEDILVEEGPQIERGTVFLRGTCHCEILQRSIRDKRIPREAFLTWVMSKWRTSWLPSMKKRMKTLSWRKDHKLKRGTVSLGDTC